VELKDQKLFKADSAVDVSDIQLQDNPLDVTLFSSSPAEQDHFVNKIALRNSLIKMKATLLEMQRDLSLLQA
jgi:hypothetical protein